MIFPHNCFGSLFAIYAWTAEGWQLCADVEDVNVEAYLHWFAHDDHDAIEDIIRAISLLWKGAQYSYFAYDPFWPAGALYYYLNNCIEVPAIDMDTLLSTMLTASPEQTMSFVGLVDAYRQSVWNRPFNQEYFAALARGFEQWE